MAYRIVVDAGHGGDDPGAVYGNLQEKDYNLKAANYMYERFQDLGIPVVSTRTDDTTLSRNERLNTMKSLGTDSQVIILSNHINSGGGEGAEVIYPLRSNDTLARSILESIGEEGQPIRKYYQRRLPEDPSKDYYYIMRETPNTTALLIEYGFIDNSNDVKRLDENLLDYVEAVVKAVANYTGTPYTTPDGISEIIYTVKKGDTLYSIANKFGTTVNNLKQLNNLTTDNLSVGQILKLSTIPESTPAISYQVQSGDTLYKIAKQFNITVRDLINYNNLTNTLLTVGQILLIPTSDQNEEIGTLTYTVQSGDSLWKIAQNYNITVDDLIKANNLNNTTLQIGDILIIPTGTLENPIPPLETYITYIVQPGDSLWKIANTYDTTIDVIKRLNSLSSNFLQIGQQLLIPTTDTYITYIVKSGDNLWMIARNYNTTVDRIRLINDLTSDVLSIGQQLQIPVE